MYDLIIDCYTDEPSGLGVPPYIGTYQRYLSQALSFKNIENYYITIDDLRYYKNGNKKDELNYKKTTNLTLNKNNVENLINNADNIYIISGCFINYNYFSCQPPLDIELYQLIKDIDKNITLFYELGIKNNIDKKFYNSLLYGKINKLVLGNPYKYILSGKEDNYESDYELLSKISNCECSILDQLERPYIIELETGVGCNHGKCSFCIEAMRKSKIDYREVNDILKEVKILHRQGARHFRLGKQPNFFNYYNKNVNKFEKLLSGIRSIGKIKTLHIDNVNAEDVITDEGVKITSLLAKYGTSGNIANFGVETFDPVLRDGNRLNGTIDEIHKAVEVINEYGSNIQDDGLYDLLPGINILYGLPLHRKETLDYNIKNLEKILNNGLKTRRIYIRRITNPYGFNYGLVGKYGNDDEDFLKFEKIINEKFIMPMQEKIYKIGTVIKGLEDIVYDGNSSIIRKIGTCPERFVVDGVELESGKEYDIKIISHIGPRVMKAEVI